MQPGVCSSNHKQIATYVTVTTGHDYINYFCLKKQDTVAMSALKLYLHKFEMKLIQARTDDTNKIVRATRNSQNAFNFTDD